jgi:aspartate/methionine/tyrosine aminotransferase
MLTSFFSRHQDVFEWYEPKAGPIAFPNYLGESVEQFCDELVRQTGVLLLPGTVYGEEYNCFRIGFGRSNMAEGLQKIEQFLVESG